MQSFLHALIPNSKPASPVPSTLPLSVISDSNMLQVSNVVELHNSVAASYMHSIRGSMILEVKSTMAILHS